MGREIRKVAPNWEHPKKDEKLKEWLINNADFWGYKWDESSIDKLIKYGGYLQE